MNDQHDRSARLRYTATGALAALAAVGAIAGAAALAAKPMATTPPRRDRERFDNQDADLTRAGQDPAPQPGSSQPFLIAVQRLVNDGTITATEAQAVDREILAGRVDSQTLSGFTPAQLQAVQHTL